MLLTCTSALASLGLQNTLHTFLIFFFSFHSCHQHVLLLLAIV